MPEVLLTKRAQQDLDGIHKWWSENRSPQQADKWYVGFVDKMLQLKEHH